ncbi:MAG: H-X9-DG-CTERM domain-containing protein, partial [Armatimonadota bacterium]
MLGELINPDKSKPYVLGGGDEILAQATATVEKNRHNDGAVFAYVDGHVQWMGAAQIVPTIFLPSVPTKALTQTMKLGAVFDNVVHGIGSVYNQNVRLALANAGLKNAVAASSSLGNGYVCFYDDIGSVSYQMGVNGAGPNEISPTLNTYDPTTATTPHAIPWWQLGAGGTQVTGFAYNSFCCGWGAKQVSPITGCSNTTAVSTTIVIKPTVSGVKKVALVAYNWHAVAQVLGTMNYIRLGSDT